MRCTYCGSEQHTKELCPHTWGGSAARANLRCAYCGGRDHNIEACPKNANAGRRRAGLVDAHFILDPDLP